MTRVPLIIALLLVAGPPAWGKKVYLNPSNQTSNPVAGGGNEAQYALINAKLAKPIIAAAGHSVTVDQDFYNAPKNANSWGADIFISIHSNAGGGHGIETLYLSSGGKVLAGKVNAGLVAELPYQNRGLKQRTDLHVLNNTNMYACLTEVLFHDCAKTSGYTGHPPSESGFLKSSDGQKKIAAGIASGACSYFGGTCSGTTTTVTKGFLKGAVYRSPDMKDRIAGAKVKLSTGQSTTASSTGLWSFELPPGKYTATATAPGYTSGSSSGTVVAGQDVWASIGLEPDPTTMPDAGVDGPAPGDGGVDADPADIPTYWIGDGAEPPRRPRDGCSVAGRGGAPGLALVLILLLGLRLRRRR